MSQIWRTIELMRMFALAPSWYSAPREVCIAVALPGVDWSVFRADERARAS